MKDKPRNYWKIAFIVLASILGLFILLLIFAPTPQENIQNNFPSENTSSDLEDEVYMTISGVNQVETINQNHPVNLVMSGTNNLVTITKTTEIRDIVLSGVNNKVILCTTHTPIIQKSGSGLEVIYRNC